MAIQRHRPGALGYRRQSRQMASLPDAPRHDEGKDPGSLHRFAVEKSAGVLGFRGFKIPIP